MRWYILRTLLHKELLRHLANRGGLALLFLLIVAAMLLSLFGKPTAGAGGLNAPLQICYIDCWENSAWVEHLKETVPPELAPQIQFRSKNQIQTDRDLIVYRANCGAIQLRLDPDMGLGTHYLVWIWYPGPDADIMAPYEAWFWRETQTFLRRQAAAAL